jgi:hypothetical protein
MSKLRLFISSVQKEFEAERAALREYVHADPLLRRFFEVFLFEDIPAKDRRADEVYLEEVDRCDLYIGLFGDQYGYEDRAGISPTEREFDEATRLGKTRLIYVKGIDDKAKRAKMQKLIRKASPQLIRRRFVDTGTLLPAVYASLVEYLEEKRLLAQEPFDGAACAKASVKDLQAAVMKQFVHDARAARGFPLKESATGRELLTHLNLLSEGKPTNAAVLLFGKEPQKFLPSSEVKCAHFHGTEVAKPIPSYQVYKGTVFALVDQAVDFVMAKLALRVGTRATGPKAPVEYEIPREVVAEGIVNAIAHRDYSSNGSVQVMLFADRLEIWNPGRLPSTLTVEQLRKPHGSVPFNPLLAEPLYLTKYIERLGTGTRDMISRSKAAGLKEPGFSIRDGFVLTIWRPRSKRATDQVTDPVADQVSDPVADPVTDPVADPVDRVILVVGMHTVAPSAIQQSLQLKHRPTFRKNYLRPALKQRLIEMTLPGKPSSHLQKYRLTATGRTRLKALTKKGKTS